MASTTNGNSHLDAGKFPYFGAHYKESVLALNLLSLRQQRMEPQKHPGHLLHARIGSLGDLSKCVKLT